MLIFNDGEEAYWRCRIIKRYVVYLPVLRCPHYNFINDVLKILDYNISFNYPIWFSIPIDKRKKEKINELDVGNVTSAI